MSELTPERLEEIWRGHEVWEAMCTKEHRSYHDDEDSIPRGCPECDAVIESVVRFVPDWEVGGFVIVRRGQGWTRKDAERARMSVISEYGHHSKQDPQLSVVRLSTWREGLPDQGGEWEWAVVAHLSRARHRKYLDKVREGEANAS